MTKAASVICFALLAGCVASNGNVVQVHSAIAQDSIVRFAANVCLDLQVSDGQLSRIDHVDDNGVIHIRLSHQQHSEFEKEAKSLGVDLSRVRIHVPNEKVSSVDIPILECRFECDDWATWYICKAAVPGRYEKMLLLGGESESYWVTSGGVFFYYCYVETA
jgi:hypothetical protein